MIEVSKFETSFSCYTTIGEIMKDSMKKEFDKEERYKLFRRVKDLTHPTISKKNISDYKIVLEEDLFPVRVFYPSKVSNIEEVMVYIPGDGRITNCLSKYTDICSELAISLDKLIIAIDYFEEEYNEEKIERTVKYLYKELKELEKNIFLLGDSNGGTVSLKVSEELTDLEKIVLFYPLISGDYSKSSKFESIIRNYNIHNNIIENINIYSKKYLTKSLPAKKTVKKILILVGTLDPVLDENKEYIEKCGGEIHILDFATHGFINTNDPQLKMEYIEKIKEFL